MKNMLISAVLAGVALAGVILYLMNEYKKSPRKLINVEDGMPIDV